MAESFAQLIHRLRMTAGQAHDGSPKELSFRELAARSGGKVSHQYVWAIENGTRDTPKDPEIIRAIAVALGNTTFEELMAAAGYARKPGSAGEVELSAVLSRLGLSEKGIAEVEDFYRFVRERERGTGAKRRRA